MKKNEIIRAWRDGEFYASLSEEERRNLPANPAELPAVEDDVLQSVSGGCSYTNPFCPTSSICTPCGQQYCL